MFVQESEDVCCKIELNIPGSDTDQAVRDLPSRIADVLRPHFPDVRVSVMYRLPQGKVELDTDEIREPTPPQHI